MFSYVGKKNIVGVLILDVGLNEGKMAADILFVTDFDGTLTKCDTSYLSFHSTRKYINATDDEKEELKRSWRERSTDYYSGYKKLLGEKLSAFTNTGCCDVDALFKLLACLDEYNLESRRNLARRNFLDDILLTNLDCLVMQIEFHPNALETLLNFQKVLKTPSKVLSVNWFPQLLHHALKGVVNTSDIYTASIPVLNKSEGGNNDIDFGKVATCMEKQMWIKKCAKKNEKSRIIYVGDSITDLAALLEASYGILFGDNELARKVAITFGVKLIPLNEVIKSDKRNSSTQVCNDSKTIYISKDWKEIEKLVMSLLE